MNERPGKCRCGCSDCANGMGQHCGSCGASVPPVGATQVDWMDNRTWLCRACGATGIHKVDHDCPVGATDSPDESIQRFGLTLTKADFDKLGDALEVINEAERRALAGPDYAGAVTGIRALAADPDIGYTTQGEEYILVKDVLAVLNKAGCP